MPLVFKAPVEFFASDLYPDRCLLTGRAEHLQHFDLQLPYLNAGIAAIVLPLRPNALPAARPAAAADPRAVPPDPNASAATLTGHPPLPQQRRSLLRKWLGIALWIFLAGWLGAIFDRHPQTGFAPAPSAPPAFSPAAPAFSLAAFYADHTVALIVAAGMAAWIAIYNLFIRPWHRRRIDAQALHFTIALAEPTTAERRLGLALTLAQTGVSSLYYLVLFAIAAPRQFVPVEVGMTVFWTTWLCFMLMNTWRNKRYPVLRLYPKQQELEIRLPNARKKLYDQLCTQFMDWKKRENFATAIRYDIDSQVDDFPDIDNGSWDQADTR